MSTSLPESTGGKFKQPSELGARRTRVPSVLESLPPAPESPLSHEEDEALGGLSPFIGEDPLEEGAPATAGRKPSSSTSFLASAKPGELPPSSRRGPYQWESLEASLNEPTAEPLHEPPPSAPGDIFTQLLDSITALRVDQRALQAQVARMQQHLTPSHPFLGRGLSGMVDLAGGNPVPPVPTVKPLTHVQALHSAIQGTPGEVPPLARCTDGASRLLVLKAAADDHGIRFQVTKDVARCLAEARFGSRTIGLQLQHIHLVPPESRLSPSVTMPSEVSLALGDGQALVLPVQEAKPDPKGPGVLKAYPLTGLFDLHLRVQALGLALEHLYPGSKAADAAIKAADAALHRPSDAPLGGALLPQSLAILANALHRATLDMGHDLPHYAAMLQEHIEHGLDLYMLDLTKVAVQIVAAPHLASDLRVPLQKHWELVLTELQDPAQMAYNARRAAPLALPVPKAPVPKPTKAALVEPPPPPSVSTLSGAFTKSYPKGFVSTHMPSDPDHEKKAQFCLNHIRKPGSCPAASCRFSHNPMKANAFSNEAVLALLGQQN